MFGFDFQSDFRFTVVVLPVFAPHLPGEEHPVTFVNGLCGDVGVPVIADDGEPCGDSVYPFAVFQDFLCDGDTEVAPGHTAWCVFDVWCACVVADPGDAYQ